MMIEGDMPTPDGHCRSGYRAAAAALSNQDVTGWADGDSMRASEPLTALHGGQMRQEEPEPPWWGARCPQETATLQYLRGIVFETTVSASTSDRALRVAKSKCTVPEARAHLHVAM